MIANTDIFIDVCLQVKIVDNAQNDIRVVGTIALIVMQAIIIIGTEWESKVYTRQIMFIKAVLIIMRCGVRDDGTIKRFTFVRVFKCFV